MSTPDAPRSVNLAAAEPRVPRTPSGLRARGRRFWRETVAEYELTRSELALLEEIARTMDDVDLLHAAVRVDGATVLGSKEQIRAHPALVELRQQRAALGKLLAQLALPDDDGQVLQSPTRARNRRGAAAANARWEGWSNA